MASIKNSTSGELYRITDARCERSPGAPHEFYSEGDYWWPDPASESGLPYIKRDGLSNPDNFNEHRVLLMRMSRDVAELTLRYEKTGLIEHAVVACNILHSWFVAPETYMVPHLKYAQAIPGRCTGRGLGIIDTLHLAEAALAVIRLDRLETLNIELKKSLERWFSEYLEWLISSEHGLSEKSQKNNHSTCWYLQVAAFALLTDNRVVIEMCRNDYINILLSGQMASDGSFPLELERTKPYCYAIFNLEVMTALCQLLSDDNNNLFEAVTVDGLSIHDGIEFMYPYLFNKSSWPYVRDIMHWESWPNKQPCLLFSGLAYNEQKYLDLWNKMSVKERDFEAWRNTPVKNPELWFNLYSTQMKTGQQEGCCAAGETD